jgi:hypothetical protein
MNDRACPSLNFGLTGYFDMKFFLFFLVCFSSFSLGGEIDKNNSKSDLLSINECEFYYDNERFDLEWPVERLVKTLGEPAQYFEYEKIKYNSIYITWETIGITIKKFVYEDGRISSSVFINLSEDDYSYYKWYRYENQWSVEKIYKETSKGYGNAFPYKGFYLNGKKIIPSISYRDFFDLYGYDLKDFVVEGKSYMLRRPCGNGRDVYFDIGQGGGWTYKGSGHLMYKDKYIPIGPHSIPFFYIWFE